MLVIRELKGTTMNLILLEVYAITLDAAEETKDTFYDVLQDAVDIVYRRYADCHRGLERKAQSRGQGNTAYPGQVCSWHEVR